MTFESGVKFLQSELQALWQETHANFQQNQPTVTGAFSAVKSAISSSKIGHFYRTVKEEISEIYNKLFSNKVWKKEDTIKQLENAPTKEAYYQVLAHVAAYEEFQEGERLPAFQKLPNERYIVHRVMQDNFGFKALILAPVDENKKTTPLVIFRGTVSNIHNLADDANEEIGQMSFQRNRKKIEEEIQNLYNRHGPVHVLGHSLGGALAQRATSDIPRYIKRCSYYNAPGIGKRGVDLFKKRIQRLPPEISPPKIRSFRHAKDLVSLAGGEHLPTKSGDSYTFGSINDRVSHLAAHSIMPFMNRNATISIDTPPHSSLKPMRGFIHEAHVNLGKIIVPLYKIGLFCKKTIPKVANQIKEIGQKMLIPMEKYFQRV